MNTVLRIGTVATLLAMTALVSSCGSMRPDRQTTNSIPDDYRTRHPITLAEVEHNLDVPVGAGQGRLTPGTRDIVKGFAQDYLSLSRGTIAVAVPVGAANSGAANAVRAEIRKSLADAGIASARIIQTSYSPQSPDASAPVRLSFVGVTAITDDCGQWPSDLFGPTVVDNTNWENFGCATQQNLAAQIANPADLVGPRGMTPIDAQRRAEVIRIYREG
ncbi:CpaD family pilus assembly lipoprotein [Rhizobium sp. KVB221]|uniref:CpaD family pilus assembly lipoprotein n=2 Tax=Rhizobium setariae TaxID=2801340 RepID=A0A937CP32_9HYPH|nr:CpaD family pilus assembly lipoprotein [Rhizobium setariae]